MTVTERSHARKVNECATSSESHPVVLFDGVCNLCNEAVQFIVKRDSHARFRFAALQSDAAVGVLRSIGATESLPDSIILIENNCVYTRSTAALRIARLLRFPWPLLYGLVMMPRPLRNWMYDIVARNRYRWFGRQDACMVPRPELESRFLR